jgi:hypothetical protein
MLASNWSFGIERDPERIAANVRALTADIASR